MGFQRLQSICDFYYLFNKASYWYYEVLDQLSFRDAVCGEMSVKDSDSSSRVRISILWQRECSKLLSQMPPPNPEECMELTKLSRLFPENIKKKAIQLSSRCVLLWNVLANKSGEVLQSELQQVMSWKQNIASAQNESPEAITPFHEKLNSESILQTYPFDINACQYLRGQTKAKCVLHKLQHPKLLPITAGYFNSDKMSGLLNESRNPWLSLPLANVCIGLQWQPVNKHTKAPKNKSALVSSSTSVHACAEPIHRPQGIRVSAGKDTGVPHSCGVHTDEHNFNVFQSKRTYHPERHVTSFKICKRESNTDPNISATLNAWNFEIFGSSVGYPCKKDWDLKEQETFYTIEDHCYTEAILKDSYVRCNHKDIGEKTFSERCKNVNTSASYCCGTNDFSHSPMRQQTYTINLLRELEEMYAIEECIFEEHKKIKEFREMVQTEATEEQESLFKQYRDKLFFLSLLERERNHVDKLEKSLSRAEEKKKRQLREKIDMVRIKKYCQDVIKESIMLVPEYKCQHAE